MKTPHELYVVYDLETTGLNEEKHAVIEIAMCVMDSKLKDVAEWESGIMQVYDNREIQQQALDHNGITRKQIEEGRCSNEVVKEMISFIKSLKTSKSKVILCGQNIIKFDNKHLENFLNFHGKKMETYFNPDFYIDTMFWGRTKHLEIENNQLHTLCAAENIPLIDAHRALTDTRANKELVRAYIRNLRGEGISATKEKVRPRTKFEF